MASERFPVIVVGAGPAGCAAAYRLAKAGVEVLLMEKGKTPGAKNVSGGRLYSYALEALMPGEWQDAPLEREVIREVITVLTADSSISLDCKLSGLPPRLSYTVLRAKLDEWLARKAEEAGAMLVTGAKVESLMGRDGRAVGVKTADEELEADIVICADGVNSLLASQAKIVPPLRAEHTAVAVKQVIALGEETINERFNVRGPQGAGLLLLGACTGGLGGGGFIYTNRDSISLGVVVDSLGLKKSGRPIADIAENMKYHPSIAPLIAGGELVEYSAHLIPEGGIKMVPKLYADGLMIAGDAAGLVINNGFTVRGMDYAIMSGLAAADTAAEALAAGSSAAAVLKSYAARLGHHVLRDMETFRHTHEFMVSTPELYTTYPEILAAIVQNIFTIEGDRPSRLPGILRKAIFAKVSPWKLLKDGVKGVRAV
jgi:electron transfer flavoprotein-quinone oxidoreductase